MYEGDSYFRQYCRRYHKKKRRIKFAKRFCAAMMSVGLAVLSIYFADKVLAKTFNVPEETEVSSESIQILNGLPGESVSGNNIPGNNIPGNNIPGNDVSGNNVLPESTAEGVQTENPLQGNTIVPEILVENPGTPVVFVDAGHGGEDEGCAREGVQEKEVNLAIARLVQEKLEDLGYSTVMAREDDTYISKEDRVKIANELQADIYVSIHQNASEDVSVSGLEVWYEGADGQRDSERLAQLIQQQTVKSTGASEREIRGDADFHVTGETTMPACLIETGFLSNREERQKLTTAEYQEQMASGIVQGIEYYFHPKTMYLTFDDGPSVENTGRVLDILKERNIKATFFLVGENVRKHPEMAKRIVDEGHTIGIHCDSHEYEAIYASAESYIQDFETARQTVYEVTGVETNIFRFPGGSVNAFNKGVRDEIIKEMTERGYVYYDWNASLEDAVKKSEPEQLIKNGVETTLGRKKVIMLAHDVIYNTGICLEDLLDSLPEYEMLPVTEEVEPIHF